MLSYIIYIFDPPGLGEMDDDYFHTWCPSVCPNTSSNDYDFAWWVILNSLDLFDNKSI